MAGFTEYERPPRNRGGSRNLKPFLSVGKNRHCIFISSNARELIQLRCGLDRVVLLIDRQGKRLGIRLDKDGPYRLNNGGQVSCRDFLIEHPIKPGRYPSESPSRNVLAAHVTFIEEG